MYVSTPVTDLNSPCGVPLCIVPFRQHGPEGLASHNDVDGDEFVDMMSCAGFSGRNKGHLLVFFRLVTFNLIHSWTQALWKNMEWCRPLSVRWIGDCPKPPRVMPPQFPQDFDEVLYVRLFQRLSPKEEQSSSPGH